MKISEMQTDIGEVSVHVISDDLYVNISKKTKEWHLENYNFKICIYEFDPVYPAISYTDDLKSKGWAFLIKKLNDYESKCELKCEVHSNAALESSIETGEGLDSILITKFNDSLSIGTEGVDAIIERIKNNDLLPKRLLEKNIRPENIILLEKYKIKINVPHLLMNEIAYFHFIVSHGTGKSNSSTNVMVDQSKNNVIELLKLSTDIDFFL